MSDEEAPAAPRFQDTLVDELNFNVIGFCMQSCLSKDNVENKKKCLYACGNNFARSAYIFQDLLKQANYNHLPL